MLIENSCLLQGVWQMHWISWMWGDGHLSSQCTWNTLVVCALHSIHILFTVSPPDPTVTTSHGFITINPSVQSFAHWRQMVVKLLLSMGTGVESTYDKDGHYQIVNSAQQRTTGCWTFSRFFRSGAIWDRGWVAMSTCRCAVRAHTTLKKQARVLISHWSCD